jgi:hypothetical protein
MDRRPSTVAELITRMDELLAPLEAAADNRRFFLATYRRTTVAVAAEIDGGGFEDSAWVERWDVAFADLYLVALEQWNASNASSKPWTVAFEAARDSRLPPLRHVLLGMNAHINYDLAQALLATITDEEFDDPTLLAARARDHTHIDGILAERVAAEDTELRKVERPGDRTLLDRALTPFNHIATQRFLRESRRMVWSNAQLLAVARRRGKDAYAERLGQLEELAAAKVADLRAPGQVIIRLARRGFGVELPT